MPSFFHVIIFCMIYLFILISSILLITLCLFYRKYKMLKNDVSSITKSLLRVRYGDINVRVKNLNDENLELTCNRLIETIYDREMMIKEYQSTLADKNLSLEEILKQEKQLQLFKEEFAATLTHDMKVPVIAELNSLNYLLEGCFGDLNEKQIEILKLMKSSNQELKELIENMLETYKLDQKSLSLNIKPHNFNDFLLSIIKEMIPISDSSEHIIAYNIDETSELIFDFDDFQIKRIIKNLIQNAISFSPNCSEIKIKTEKENSKIKFIISNTGNTISKDDLELIFQKYYSGHSKFRKAGTGLGLYLSQQIALAHNGNIEIDTSEDGITTFILTLN